MKSAKREKKKPTRRNALGQNTYEVTLEMFSRGMAIGDIAMERGISPGTVETHLLRYVPTGEVSLLDIVSEEKIEPIRQAIERFRDAGALAPVKEFLGDDYSYGEIRAVLSMMV